MKKRTHNYAMERKEESGVTFKAEDEINVPIALSAFRDKKWRSRFSDKDVLLLFVVSSYSCVVVRRDRLYVVPLSREVFQPSPPPPPDIWTDEKSDEATHLTDF